jgi:hypothetical protein
MYPHIYTQTCIEKLSIHLRRLHINYKMSKYIYIIFFELFFQNIQVSNNICNNRIHVSPTNPRITKFDHS